MRSVYLMTDDGYASEAQVTVDLEAHLADSQTQDFMKLCADGVLEQADAEGFEMTREAALEQVNEEYRAAWGEFSYPYLTEQDVDLLKRIADGWGLAGLEEQDVREAAREMLAAWEQNTMPVPYRAIAAQMPVEKIASALLMDADEVRENITQEGRLDIYVRPSGKPVFLQSYLDGGTEYVEFGRAGMFGPYWGSVADAAKAYYQQQRGV